MLALFLLAMILCALVVYWQLRRWRLQRLTANIQTMPGELPVLGHVLQFAGNSMEFWDFFKSAAATTNQLGGIAKLWLGPSLYFFVTDPKLAKEVLNVALDKGFVYKFTSPWLGQGLVTSDVPTWKRHRKLLNPTFSQQMLNGFLSVINKEAAHLVDSLEDNVGRGEFNVFPLTSEYSLGTICQTAIGLSAQDQASGFIKEYGEMVERMFSIMTMRFQYLWMAIDSLYCWTNTKREEDKVVKHLVNMSTDVIQKKKATFHVKESEHRFKAFLDVLLEHGADGSLTQQEIREEVDTIITGGSDTTASALVYILVMLGSYPEVQDKVYGEVKKVFGDSNRDVTKEDLPLLVYTEAAIKEILRLYPTVPIIGRVVRDRDIKIADKFTIPKDSNILVNIMGIHTNSCWGTDAHLFRPERWLSPGTVPDDGSCFAPFSLGRRSCIGKGYAMMSMKATLAHVIRRYRVKGDYTKLRSRWDVLLKPASGSEISVELRN